MYQYYAMVMLSGRFEMSEPLRGGLLLQGGKRAGQSFIANRTRQTEDRMAFTVYDSCSKAQGFLHNELSLLET